MIVATAGHIDHGKTLLVKKLTGVDTDHLPEEKTRGISIDLGFAYLPLPGGGLIGFVDVPGHERFIRNMLAGVCGIDFALLVAAADDGVMPQTVEHLQILDLLGIRQGIAVITKTDRVAPARVSEVEAQVQALLAETALAGIPSLPISSVTGAGIDSLREALVAAAADHTTRRTDGQHFRLAIDRAFSVAGSGTVVTGTVFNGKASPGDRLVLSPLGTKVRVRGVQVRGEVVEHARAGERCALNLSGVDAEAVARGDWVLNEAIHSPSQRLDVRFTLLAGERESLKHWTPVHLHLATADVMARVAFRDKGVIVPGGSGHAQLVTEQPIGALNGDRFILRDRSATRTLGGGLVIDPLARAARRGDPARLAAGSALERATPEEAFRELLKIPDRAVDLSHFEAVFNFTPERAASLYRSADAALLGRAQRVGIARAHAEALRELALARLAEFHRARPQAPGIQLDALHAQLCPWLAADAFLDLLRDLTDARRLEISGGTARLPGHDTTDNPADARMSQAVMPALLQGGFSPPMVAELAVRLGLKEAVIRDFLHRMTKAGQVMRVAEDRFYPKATLATLAANAALLARHSSRGLFTAAQYRDAVGIGRTLAIKILEFFDALGITQRIGDTRRMHRNFVPILGAAKPSIAPPAKKPGPQAPIVR